MDLENLDFSFTRTFRKDRGPVCGSGKEEIRATTEMMIEEMCGRNGNGLKATEPLMSTTEANARSAYASGYVCT